MAGLIVQDLHSGAETEAGVDPAFAVLDEATALQMRADAIAEAVGWAADDVDAVELYRVFTPDGLLALLETLVASRLKVEELLAAGAWHTWDGRVARFLEDALRDPELADCIDIMLGWERQGILASALARGDTLAPGVEALLATWSQVAACREAGDWTGVLERLPRLREAAGGSKGKAANWGMDPKEVMRGFRAAYDRCLKPLAGKVDPALDHELAQLLPQVQRVFAEAVARYQARKQEMYALDFDDLEQQALALLVGNAEVLARWRDETSALLVDEFQDTNERQRDWCGCSTVTAAVFLSSAMPSSRSTASAAPRWRFFVTNVNASRSRMVLSATW